MNRFILKAQHHSQQRRIFFYFDFFQSRIKDRSISTNGPGLFPKISKIQKFFVFVWDKNYNKNLNKKLELFFQNFNFLKFSYKFFYPK